MIVSFFRNQFDKCNIDNRKTRVYLPFLFIGYMVILFCVSIMLKKIFPFEEKVVPSGVDKELNITSIILFLIFAAIMEELKYRGLLTKFSYRWVLISFSVLITSVVFLIFNVNVYYLYPESLLPLFGYIALFSLLSVIIYLALFKILFDHQEKIREIFDANFNLIIWIQVFLFAIWHILFSGQGNETHFMSLFIFHSLAALFFTFIRINYGILYSIVLHFLHNFLVAVVPILLVKLSN